MSMTMTLSSDGHPAHLAESLPALDRWAALTDSLEDPAVWEHLDTQDVVAALIDRSLVEDDLQGGADFPNEQLVRLVRADQRFRAAAAHLLDRTDIHLFRDDEPPTHWWWHVEQLVLGHAGEQLLAVPAAAALKDVHPHTIRAAIRDGRLPARRLARGFLIHRRDLERWQPRAVGRPKGGRSNRTDTLLESFNAANTAGDWQRAARLAEAIERDASTPRRRLAVALTAFNAGDDGKAEHWAALALEGDLPQASRQTALLVQGRALLRRGRPRRAQRVLESARGLGYSDWLIDAALADAYLDSGDARHAVEVARRARHEAPDVPEVHYQLARMLWHADEPWEAFEHVIRFRALRPDEPEGRLLHGSILGFLGDRTGEEGLYERARLIVKPLVEAGSPEALSIEGQSLGSLGRWKAALRIARRLLRISGDAEEQRRRAWHVVKAAVEAAMGTADAEACVMAARGLLGEDDFLTQSLATIKAVQGDVEGTLAALGVSMEELAETEGPRRFLGALALLHAGRGGEAHPLFKSMAGDLNATPFPIMVDAALAAGDVEGAREGLRALALVDGIEGRIADLAVRILEQVEHSGSSRTGGRVQAAEPSPGWPWIAVRLGAIHRAQDSTWEGVHRRTSSVIDRLTRSFVH